MTETGLLHPQPKLSLRVRRANPSDIEALAGIEAQAFATDRLSRRSLRSFVSAPSAALLVAERGTVLGYALVNLRKNGRVARLYSLAVAPGSNGQGIGAQLLAAAEGAALDRGCDRLRLEVRADNAGAVRFYESHGYTLFGRRADYYADSMAALRFERPLNVIRARGSAPPCEPLEAAADG